MPAQKRPAPSSAPSTASKPTSSPAVVGALGVQPQNWKKRKQERAHTARFIETQTPTATSSASTSRTASKASTPVPAQFATSTASNLPTSIELESLVSSRAFQIQSFLRSIKSAKSATTTRAWQLLPRHARRRAASHNLLRLPSRLRSKALAELRSSTTQARSRSDIRKRLPSHGVIRAALRRKKLAHRASHPQRRWLETHLWHSKRFRMTTEKGKGKEKDQGTEFGRWGFVLPETTMMKSHRASWRSAKEYVTVHDASYTSVFRVGVRVADNDAESSQSIETALLEQLLERLNQAGFANASDLRSSHVVDIVLVQTKAVPQSSRANPAEPGPSRADAALAPVRIVLLSGTRRFERPSVQQDTYVYACKEALLFVHPAADLHVRRALKSAGITMTDENKNSLFDLESPPSQLIQPYATQLESAPDPWLAAGGKDSSLSRLEKGRRRQAYKSGSAKVSSDSTTGIPKDDSTHRSVLLDDKAVLMRRQGFNLFELIGPRAPALLQSVLKVHQAAGHEADESNLRQILSGPAKSAPNMVEVQVDDPRLSYPPKLKQMSTHEASKTSKETINTSHNDNLLWHGSSPPRFSKGEIDSRRALNAIPGVRLQPDSRDDAVPVVLIRDSLVQKPQMERYTLIVPRGWGTAFFLSLVATHQSGASSGARVLGQHQLKHQKLELAALSCSNSTQKRRVEASILSYPHNWLGTQAHAVSEKESAVARQEEWSRRPKGKRTEYLFASHKEWKAFQQARIADQVVAKLSQDRTGVVKPYPFGGSHHWEWIVNNSERLFSKAHAGIAAEAQSVHPWLVARPDVTVASLSTTESALSASYLSSAMIAVKLHAVRKGTVMPLSSLILAPTFEDHLCWVHHLDSTDHPAIVNNRTLVTETGKMDKQHLKSLIDRRTEIMQLGRSAPPDSGVKRKSTLPASDVWSRYVSEAFDPEELHDRSADWNNAIGTVLDGDYSLGNGKGFGIGAITLRAWMEVVHRQKRLDATSKQPEKGRRRARNPIETTHLLLMREPGTDVVRAVTASFIPLM